LVVAPQTAVADDWYWVGVGVIVLSIVFATFLVQLIATLFIAALRWRRRGIRSALVYFSLSLLTGLIAWAFVWLMIALVVKLPQNSILDIAPAGIPVLVWIAFLFSVRKIDFRLRT
jgi:hypothetical protein